MKVKAVRGVANPLGTIDSHGTVIESIANAGDGVDILNRHREKIGSGFVHLEGDNVILTGYVDEEQYTAEKIEETGLSVACVDSAKHGSPSVSSRARLAANVTKVYLLST